MAPGFKPGFFMAHEQIKLAEQAKYQMLPVRDSTLGENICEWQEPTGSNGVRESYPDHQQLFDNQCIPISACEVQIGKRLPSYTLTKNSIKK